MQPAQPLFDAFDLQASLAGGVHGQSFRVRQSRQRSDDSQVFLKRRRISAEPLLQKVFPVLEDSPVSLRCEWEEHVVATYQKIAVFEDELDFTAVEDLTV